MKKLLAILLFLSSSAAFAQKIANLPAASSIGSTDLIIVEQGGTTKQATAGLLNTPQNGGTGVANNASATVTSSGNFAYTRTLTGATNVTFPTSGTLLSTSSAPTFSTKATGGMLYWDATASPGNVANAVVTGPVCGNGTSAPALCVGQTATQAIATPYIIYKQGIAMLYPGTGTMTSGGVFTLGTNLGNSVYPARVLVWFPATTVASSGTGSTAGWYFATMSAINTGQVVDITPYDPTTGVPPVWPASPIAPTTATNWAGDTASAKTFISFSVPAGAMGVNGALDVPAMFISQTNNANAKTYTLAFGGFNAAPAISLASLANTFNRILVINNGSASLQHGLAISGTTVQPPAIGGTVNTGNAVTVSLTMTRATATDNMMLWNFEAELKSNGS